MRPLTLDALNALERDAFVAAVGFAFENSPWIAAAAWEYRPFHRSEDVLHAMMAALRAGGERRRLALIRAHPDLAGRLAREGRITAASRGEQGSAGLDRLPAAEVARFDASNEAYRKRFGFPFVICAREHDKDSILEELDRRLGNGRADEIETALGEIEKIARLRLRDALA